jgi:carbon-monoxide dehydrogenase small subunit
MRTITFTLNDQQVTAEVAPHTLLVDFLRTDRGLTGTHVGCDTSQCGACTVLVDGRAARSCAMLAVQAEGTQITTIEGLGTPEAPHPIQQAFMQCHGLQCGFCTPGMVMSTASLLRSCPNPTDEQIVHGLEGNLCRCTGYVNIVESVRVAAAALK